MFRSFMAKKLDELNFVSSAACPDVWLRPAVKPDGSECCKHVSCHVDDILATGADPKGVSKGPKGGTVRSKNDKMKFQKCASGLNCGRRPLTTSNAGPSPVKNVSKLQ